MKQSLENHLNQDLPYLKNKKLLVAVSGGLDSIVLCTLLNDLNYDITIAHCNFKLRGKESDKDELFVKSFAEKLKVPFFTKSFDTEKKATKNGISIQMAARELRYKWFKKIIVKNNLDYIITAHHKDDVLETFLINFTRGTGYEGLVSIPEKNNNIIRPLLPYTKTEILVHATQNKLSWREDKSNSSIKYVRNKIRHKVIPVLKELNPSLMDSFEKTMTYLNESNQIIKDRIANVYLKVAEETSEQIVFKIKKIKQLSNPKAYLYYFLKEYGFTEWNDVVDLLDAQSGKQLFSNTHRLLKDRKFLILSKINLEIPNQIFINKDDFTLKEPLQLKITTINNNENLIFDANYGLFDLDKIKFPLLVRKWQKGDYFYPFGMEGKKKLSKFFKDEKMSVLEKENTWLLCSENEIIWIIGKRTDNRYKITNTTTQILKIELKT